MAPNPFGAGWAMLCNRGITCEFHVQAVTAHTTNTPEKHHVEAAVQKHLPNIQRSWSGFCELASGWNDSDQDFQSLEGIGVQVLRMWCERIVQYAERLFMEEW